MRVKKLAALAACVLLACGGRPGGGAATPPGVVGATGAPIAMVLPALDGGSLDLASLRGQIVVLHVFTTWSLAAQAEVDALRAADQRPDVTVVGVALDPEGHLLVAPWRNASEVRYLIGLADDAVRAGKSPLGPLPSVPTTIVLDRAGRIHGRADRQLTPAELDAMIAAAARAARAA
ncbi:MAG TPA: TlpA disulfide reductase family protein [Kofleriaceae bacterium]|jgi:hypothetical protein|nr:TlpA disulfide reductase family protein [Kofleriaceae bacterium]